MINKLFLPKWMEIMVHADRNMNRIFLETNITYSHVYNVFKEFENKGWIIVKKVGREKVYEFTEEGKKIQELCLQLQSFKL